MAFDTNKWRGSQNNSGLGTMMMGDHEKLPVKMIAEGTKPN